MHVQEGDSVKAGDRLTEGPVNPHDTLKIKGIQAVQEYLVNEIQEVYRLQGVRIDDKHIEVIVRQMLKRSGSRIRATRTSSKGSRSTRPSSGTSSAEVENSRCGQLVSEWL